MLLHVVDIMYVQLLLLIWETQNSFSLRQTLLTHGPNINVFPIHVTQGIEPSHLYVANKLKHKVYVEYAINLRYLYNAKHTLKPQLAGFKFLVSDPNLHVFSTYMYQLSI